jgi:hypothetical protein
MFACLYSLSTPTAALLSLAESFTPRVERRGPLVLLDLSGLARLFGSVDEIGAQLRRAAPGPIRIAIAPTQTAAALLALGRAGLTVVLADPAAALAGLPVGLVGTLDAIQLAVSDATLPGAERPLAGPARSQPSRPRPLPPSVGSMWDALPMFESMLDRTSDLAVQRHLGGRAEGGWTHPRDAHAAARTRAIGRLADTTTAPVHGSTRPGVLTAGRTAPVHRTTPIALIAPVLQRWGIKTLGALAALPADEVYARLGAAGVRWQRLARGEDACPLVPWTAEEPFDASLTLEWPIEGLEPLSFVLGRLLEPLSERLERAGRGAAVLHTHLRLVSKTMHARTVPLPAPMRDPKTLRTLILLDLESHPPSAAVDEVRLLIEPTPARVLQWTLYERARPSPEQTATLLARLTALMGDGHVGSPQIVDSWRPGQFALTPFVVRQGRDAQGHRDTEAQRRQNFQEQDLHDSVLSRAASYTTCAIATPVAGTRPTGATRGETQDSRAQRTQIGLPGSMASALRRFRLPIPVRVQMHEGRPVRVMPDRRGLAGGAVLQAAGPWRTSGEWWNDAPAYSSTAPAHVAPAPSHLPPSSASGPEHSRRAAPPHLSWNRDEWDVALADGTAYRLFVERDIGQWFLDGVVD